MTLFKSISSISNGSINSNGNKIMTVSSFGSNSVGNNVACGGFDEFGGLGGFDGFGSGGFGGCGGRNVNVINVDIDIGRRRRHCC